MDDILTLVDQAIARWGTRELVSTSEAIDLLLDIRQTIDVPHFKLTGEIRTWESVS